MSTNPVAQVDEELESVRGRGTTIALAFSEDSLRERPFEWAKPPDRMAERAKKFAEKQAGGAG